MSRGPVVRGRSVDDINPNLQDVFKAGEPDVGDDGAAEEVDEQALDPLHLEVLLEDWAGEEEAGLRAGGDLVVGELLETFELDDPELNHVKDVLIESAAEDLREGQRTNII